MLRRLSERQAKFAREVGSVVLGVLIALGLGAVASEIGWRVEVHGARQALREELGEVIGQAGGRLRIGPCIERRLDALAKLVDAASASGRLPPLGDFGAAPYQTWSSGVWSSTISAQTAAHFDRQLLDNYSGFYEFLDQIRSASGRELQAWTTLHGLVGPGRAVTPDEVAGWRTALGEARFLNRFIVLNGVRMHQVADAFDLAYDAGTVAQYRDLPPAAQPICQPVTDPPPATYGQAPMARSVARAIANPITRENIGATSPTR